MPPRRTAAGGTARPGPAGTARSGAGGGDGRGKPPTVAQQHAEWLGLLRPDGPFIAVPVLTEAFPQGLDTMPDDTLDRIRLAWAEVQEAPDLLTPAWTELVLTRAARLHARQCSPRAAPCPRTCAPGRPGRLAAPGRGCLRPGWSGRPGGAAATSTGWPPVTPLTAAPRPSRPRPSRPPSCAATAAFRWPC